MEEVSSRAQTKGFPLLNISVGLLFVPQSGIGERESLFPRVSSLQGHREDGRPPAGYKPLKILTVYDVTHDGRHRARMVAAGHLTEVPVESVYSGVISL